MAAKKKKIKLGMVKAPLTDKKKGFSISLGKVKTLFVQ